MVVVVVFAAVKDGVRGVGVGGIDGYVCVSGGDSGVVAMEVTMVVMVIRFSYCHEARMSHDLVDIFRWSRGVGSHRRAPSPCPTISIASSFTSTSSSLQTFIT